MTWLRVQAYGDPWGAGWMRWPARWFAGMRLARNTYEAWREYMKAANRASWLKAHPLEAEAVDRVKALRRERDG